MTHWQVYQPRAAEPWNLRRVVHLHSRVVFGATQPEIERDLNDDPQQAVSRVLSGECRLNGVPEGFDRLAAIIGDSAAQSNNPIRLKAWWIYRCLYTPDPLQEKLTLMWHNHFATSNQKVDNLLMMKQQNETLRRYCRAPFRDLLSAMLRDSALLMWLDAEANRAGHPNENLAAIGRSRFLWISGLPFVDGSLSRASWMSGASWLRAMICLIGGWVT